MTITEAIYPPRLCPVCRCEFEAPDDCATCSACANLDSVPTAASMGKYDDAVTEVGERETKSAWWGD